MLTGHAQKGLPAFGIYGRDVQDLNDNSIPADVAEKILRFARAAQAVATMRGKSYLSMGSVSMGIAGSIVNPDFFQEYLGMRNESIDLTVIVAPTPSRSNFSAQAALSATRPMVPSAITHSTGVPSPFFKLEVINSATAFPDSLFFLQGFRERRPDVHRWWDESRFLDTFSYYIIKFIKQSSYADLC